MLAAISDGATCLVNGLDPEEFAGRRPVRYGRPGHIPSSINLPFVGVVDLATSTYLKPEQLHALARQTGAMGKKRVICYCGGAIAASSSAFALSLLGGGNIAVYDGSLTEWAADPVLPLVIGKHKSDSIAWFIKGGHQYVEENLQTLSHPRLHRSLLPTFG